jgi:sugar/nucleoside kinase (ribokinase family)
VRAPFDLIAIGDVMLDGTLPEPVPGQRVHGRVELRPGGSAVNAALAAARLGARTAVVGRVGADPAGRLVADAVADAGIEALLARDADCATGCAVVVGGTAVVADPGASARFAPDDLPASLEAQAVLVSGYSLLHRGSEAAARAALKRAQARWLAVDAASARLVEAFGVDRFLDATAPADVLLANAAEARALTGLDGEAAARALASRYRVACVKLGSAGAVAVAEGRLVRTAARPLERTEFEREEFERTVFFGAGDAFAGGFLVALARGAELEGALGAACDAAAAAIAAADV